MEKVTVRPAMELQRAHDILDSIFDLLDEVKASQETRHLVQFSRDLLCWVLNHPDDSFEHNLAALEKLMRELGYELVMKQ